MSDPRGCLARPSDADPKPARLRPSHAPAETAPLQSLSAQLEFNPREATGCRPLLSVMTCPVRGRGSAPPEDRT